MSAKPIFVGQDCGGFLGWATAVLHPEVVRRLVVVGAPHPLRMRQAIFGELSSQLRASGYLLGFQLPWRPERQLVRDDAALVAELMRRWSGPGFPDPETETRVRRAMQIPGVAHLSMEYYRWVFRSMFRPDGWRMLPRHARAGDARRPCNCRACSTRCVLPATAKGSGEYVGAPYTWRTLPGVGHFPARGGAGVVQRRTLELAGVSRPRRRDRDGLRGRPLNARPRDALGTPAALRIACGLEELDPALLRG